MYQSENISSCADDPLVSAACEVIAASGIDKASTREIAGRAHVSPSLITHRYGSLNRLIEVALEHAQSCHAQFWKDLPDRTPPDVARPDSFGILLQSINREIALNNSTTASLQRLHMHTALRQANACAVAAWLEPPATYWQHLIRSICPKPPRLGEDAWKLLAHTFSAIGHSYLIAGASLEVDMWNADVCQRVATRICGNAPTQSGDSYWRARLEKATAPADLSIEDPEKLKIIEAAAELIVSKGLKGVTHRAVAAHARTSLAATTRHFSSLNDIIELACVAIYAQAQQVARDSPFRARTIDDMIDVLAQQSEGAASHMIKTLASTQEIVSAIQRTPSARPIALSMLARIGQSTHRFLEDIETPGGFDRIDGFIHSQLSHSAFFCELVRRGDAFEPAHAAEALRPIANWLFRP